MPTEITMTLADWQDKQTKLDDLEKQLAETKKALDEARLETGDGDARKLAEALGHSLAIVSFAVASMTPRMFPGWPYAELDAFARAMPDLPGMPAAFRESAGDLRIFARDAKEWEEARAAGTHEVKFLEENAGGGLTLPEGALEGDLGGAARIIKP